MDTFDRVMVVFLVGVTFFSSMLAAYHLEQRIIALEPPKIVRCE